LLGALAMLANAACGTAPVGAPGAGGTTGGGAGGTVGTGGTTGGTGGTAGATGGTAGATGGSGGTFGAGGTGGGAGGQAGGVDPTALCSAWTGDLAAQNQRALEQHGFFQSVAILEGTLGERFDLLDQSYARFTIAKVRAGVTAYAGREVAIAMKPGLHATFGAGASVLVGLSSTYSVTDTAAPTPPASPPTSWGNLLAVVKKEDEASLPADLLGFRAWHAPNVAVVRVRELLDGRIGFDVIETLAGSLPAAFSFFANWSDIWGPLPVAVGDERVGGFGEIVTIMGTPLAQIVELRPNAAEERARALRGIAAVGAGGFAATYRDALDRARAEATRYRLAWTFGRSERVLAVELAGTASECCTGAGGTFFANTVSEVLRGDAPAGPVVTGGQGVSNEGACGDRFLFAMRRVATTATGSLTDYTCARPSTQLATLTPTSLLEARLPGTPANRDDIALWLRSAPPLLRLYASGVAAPAGAFTPPSAPALLSVPVPALTAIQARHQLVLLTIVDVQQQPGGGATIRVRTPFSFQELAHLPNVEATLFVPCADPRLLQVGGRWVGAVMSSEPSYGRAEEVGPYLAEQRLMLVPGFLLPAERDDLVGTAEALTKVTIPRPFGR
jgi:hypothetical protein